MADVTPDDKIENKTTTPWNKEIIDFYFKDGMPKLNTNEYVNAQEFVDILVSQCLAEKNWNEGFEYFLQKVRDLGLPIETAQREYEIISSRMFNLRAVRMFISALGLGPFENEIMKYEIAKAYGNVVVMPPTPPMNRKEPAREPEPRKPRPRKETPTLTKDGGTKPIKK